MANTTPNRKPRPARNAKLQNQLEKGDYAALAQFRRALRVFLAFSEDAARRTGLTPQQHQAILAIRGLAPDAGMTVNTLAAHLLLKPQSAVELADRLEAAGLVKRQRDSKDRRRVFLTLTDKSHRLLEKLSAAHLAQISRDTPQFVELLHDVAKRNRKR